MLAMRIAHTTGRDTFTAAQIETYKNYYKNERKSHGLFVEDVPWLIPVNENWRHDIYPDCINACVSFLMNGGVVC